MTMRDRWSILRPRATVLLLAGIIAILPAAAMMVPRGVAGAEGAGDLRGRVEQVYRIKGKVRFVVFWAGADDVGGARVTWRRSDRRAMVSLLIGSEPQRAPRRVNEWGYIREEVTDEVTTVFGIRTSTGGDSPEDAEARRAPVGGLAEVGILCSTVSKSDASSTTTALRLPRDTTYRDVDRVLAMAEDTATWKLRHVSRPPGIAPGFLTALDQMMRWTAASAREIATIPAVPRQAFVYKNAVYDLIVGRIERVPHVRTRSAVFEDLLRAEVSIRNHATGTITEFRVTYGTQGALAGVPVYAQYQPNWWFRVELELDDGVEVPPDPAADRSIRDRIDTLCGWSAE